MQAASSRQPFDRASEAVRAAGAGIDTWTTASRLACDVIGADTAAFVVWRAADHAVELIEGYGHDSRLVSDYQEHFYQHDVLLDSARFENEWQVSDEVFPGQKWERHEFFGGFLHRHGVGQVIALTLRLGTDAYAAFSFHRQTRMATSAKDLLLGRHGDFTRQVVSAFAMQQASMQAARRGLVQVLSDDATVCFLAGANGAVQPLADDRTVTVRLRALKLLDGDRLLRHADGTSHGRLLRLLERACRGASAKICLRGPAGQPIRIQAQAAPSAAKQGLSQALAFVRVSVLDLDRQPDQDDLRSLFGLTAAEARVLGRVCAGRSVKQCANDLGCSPATVRTHLQHLMSKMDCARQGQLVRAAMLAA